MASQSATFDERFNRWVAAVCRDWGYALPNDHFYQRARDRLTHWTTDGLGYALESGLIIEDGYRFNLATNSGLAKSKGPYRWFSRRASATEPQCNWEYFVQVATLASLWEPCRKANLTLAFEDELMDITVRRDGELLWCLEVKERADQLERLLKGVAANGSHVELGAPDRGRDALRKAKYLVKNRPEYFTGIAIGLQRHFQMSYTRSVSFEMVEAAPPLRQVAHPPPV